MITNLTNSSIDRQNVLNNRYARERIQEYIGLPAIHFNEEYWLTKRMVADFFEVDTRTINRYLKKYDEELTYNGYVLMRGQELKRIKSLFARDIDVTSKTTQLGLFNFRSFLNLAMLLVESERARLLRAKILDIVIDTINQKTGGSTKYINKRDTDYLTSAIKEPAYRKQFTDALHQYVNMGNYKYAIYTNKVYQAIFKEKAKEYRDILNLNAKENIRETLYTEVLDLIASFEVGLAYELKINSELLGRKLSSSETDLVFESFASHPLHSPLIDKARIKMASRDLHFRDALHRKLKHYIGSVTEEDFDRFIGDQSMDFDKQLEQASEIFKRLKDGK